MTVQLYIDWDNHTIYQDNRESLTELRSLHDEECTNSFEFEDWLNARYCALDLYRMEEAEKENLLNEFLEEHFQVWLDEYFELITLEID